MAKNADPQKARQLAEQLHQAITDDEPLWRIQSLVDQGADLEMRAGANKYTALLWALFGDKHVDAALYIADAGGDPYASNGLGNALTYAFMYGRDQRKLEGLLQRKVLPDQPDDRGRTALTYAAEHGKIWAAEQLIKHGADIYLKDQDGSSAYDYALAKQGEAFADQLAAIFGKSAPPIKVMKPLVLKRPSPGMP